MVGSSFTRKLQAQCGLGESDAGLIDKSMRLLPPFPAGSTISDDAVQSDCIRVIIRGLAFRTRTTAQGARHVSAFLLPGDACDISSLFLRTPGHSVIAASRCEVATIPKRTLLHLADDFPTIMRALWIQSTLDEASMRELAFGTGRHSAKIALARLLCELHARAELVGTASTGSFPLPVTQILLGDALGLSPVHTNRTLAALRKAGLAEFHAGHVQIPDVARLRKFAQFDPSYLAVDRQRLFGFPPAEANREAVVRTRYSLN